MNVPMFMLRRFYGLHGTELLFKIVLQLYKFIFQAFGWLMFLLLVLYTTKKINKRIADQLFQFLDMSVVKIWLFQNSILKFYVGVKILNKILINEVLHKVELAHCSCLFHYIAGFFIKNSSSRRKV